MLHLTELGSRLKEARIEKGLSLDDLQEITKIQKRYLIGIEEGNYSLMPGKFYVRAFIKQYAEAVNLEPDLLFEEFKNEIPSTMNEDLPGKLSRVQSKKSITNNSSKVFDFLPKILIVLVVLAILVFAWYMFSKNAGDSADDTSPIEDKKNTTYEQSVDLTENDEEGEEQPLEEDQDVNPENQKEDDDTILEEDKLDTPTQELISVETNGRYSTFELKNTERFKLEVVSTGETWVNIKNAKGYSFFQGKLVKGEGEEERKTLDDLSQETEIIITAGRSTETEIYINDQKLEYAIPPTEEVRQDITIRYVKPTE